MISEELWGAISLQDGIRLFTFSVLSSWSLILIHTHPSVRSIVLGGAALAVATVMVPYFPLLAITGVASIMVSPWRDSPQQYKGFATVLWAPSGFAFIAIAYMEWLREKRLPILSPIDLSVQSGTLVETQFLAGLILPHLLIPIIMKRGINLGDATIGILICGALMVWGILALSPLALYIFLTGIFIGRISSELSGLSKVLLSIMGVLSLTMVLL
ncbi:MAG: hypothetical protein AAF720_10705 [Pseudomonadota bacterium]